MTGKKEIIHPYLPGFLQNLSEHEQENHNTSMLTINGEENLKEHLGIVKESLDLLYRLTILYENKDDDELALQYLAIRMFNTVVSALKLLLSGYYQNSFAVQRDLLETGLLLDYFRTNRIKINEWKTSTRQDRLRNYSPRAIRNALNARDGSSKNRRAEIYETLCEYATHPTAPSFQLTQNKGSGTIGPFFEGKKLEGALTELAIRLPMFALVYALLFPKLPLESQKAHDEFRNKIKIWSEKYAKKDLSNISSDTLGDWLELR